MHDVMNIATVCVSVSADGDDDDSETSFYSYDCC